MIPIRLPRPLAALLLGLLTACGGVLTPKRLTYRYEPSYGVASQEFKRSLEVLRNDLVGGNRAELLENGDRFFPAMLGAVAAARASVNLEVYIFTDDDTGRRFADALAERARAGVEVRVLVDGIGSRGIGGLRKRMEAAGVQVQVYHPLRLGLLSVAGRRMHRKILTVDGRVGFVGGANVDARWKGDARTPDEWLDTMVRVEGPVVAQLQSVFLEDWLYTTGEVLAGFRQFPRPEAAGTVPAQAVASSAGDRTSLAKLAVYMAIQAARERIWIENAYFVPDAQIRKGLLDAVRRGVDVRVIVPGRHTDVPFVRLASRFHYGELLDGGVQIYEYRPTMDHNKVMVVDGRWASIGSVNLVTRSLRSNAEANLSIYDEDFAKAVEAMVERNLQRADPVTKRDWRHRGFWPRLGETLSYLFSEAY